MAGDASGGEEGQKIIAIRGLDEDLYKRLLSAAKERGRNVSQLANEAISRYLNSDDEVAVLAEGTDYLSVDKQLLSSSNKPILLRSINRLVIEPDVDAATLEKIKRIESCHTVIHPPSVSIPVLERCRNCYRVFPWLQQKGDQAALVRELMNPLEWFFGEAQPGHGREVGNMPLLSLNKEQLAQFDRSVTLHKIEKLRLEEDVEREDVRKHIRGFEKISALEVPERLYPWILTLCHKCGSVVAY